MGVDYVIEVDNLIRVKGISVMVAQYVNVYHCTNVLCVMFVHTHTVQ